MILIDDPHDWGGAFNRRWGPSAHLLSDLPGDDGTHELVAFASSLGIPSEAIQCAGTYREHFDLAGPWLERARLAGAVRVDRYHLAAVLRARRTWYAAQGA